MPTIILLILHTLIASASLLLSIILYTLYIIIAKYVPKASLLIKFSTKGNLRSVVYRNLILNFIVCSLMQFYITILYSLFIPYTKIGYRHNFSLYYALLHRFDVYLHLVYSTLNKYLFSQQNPTAVL